MLGTTPGHAAANVDEAQKSCEQAAACAKAAYNEKNDKNNPGMGRKFEDIKADCSLLAAQCQIDMAAPEPQPWRKKAKYHY
jgi:hypothetical protein